MLFAGDGGPYRKPGEPSPEPLQFCDRCNKRAASRCDLWACACSYCGMPLCVLDQGTTRWARFKRWWHWWRRKDISEY